MRKKPLPSFPERDRRWPGKKDTKRWCKGVVGREHQGVWVRREYIGRTQRIWMWNVKKCLVCGKQLELDFKKIQKAEDEQVARIHFQRKIKNECGQTTQNPTEEKDQGAT